MKPKIELHSDVLAEFLRSKEVKSIVDDKSDIIYKRAKSKAGKNVVVTLREKKRNNNRVRTGNIISFRQKPSPNKKKMSLAQLQIIARRTTR